MHIMDVRIHDISTWSGLVSLTDFVQSKRLLFSGLACMKIAVDCDFTRDTELHTPLLYIHVCDFVSLLILFSHTITLAW